MIKLSDIRQKVSQMFKPTPEKRFDNFKKDYGNIIEKDSDLKNEKDIWLSHFLNEAQDNQWFYDVKRVFDRYYGKTLNKSIGRSFRDNSEFRLSSDEKKLYFKIGKQEFDGTTTPRGIDYIGMLDFMIFKLEQRNATKPDRETQDIIEQAQNLKKQFRNNLEKVLPEFDKFYDNFKQDKNLSTNSSEANRRLNENPKFSNMAEYLDQYLESEVKYEEVHGKKVASSLIGTEYLKASQKATPELVKLLNGNDEKIRGTAFLLMDKGKIGEKLEEVSNGLNYTNIYTRYLEAENRKDPDTVDLSRYPAIKKHVKDNNALAYVGFQNSMIEAMEVTCNTLDVTPAELGLENLQDLPKMDISQLKEQKENTTVNGLTTDNSGPGGDDGPESR